MNTDLEWRKSSRSNTQDCVEVAFPASQVAVRDSKNVGPALAFPRASWTVFLGKA